VNIIINDSLGFGFWVGSFFLNFEYQIIVKMKIIIKIIEFRKICFFSIKLASKNNMWNSPISENPILLTLFIGFCFL